MFRVREKLVDVTQIHPLDVRFAEVDIDRMPLFAAMDVLAAEVHKVYGEQFAFTYSYTSGPFLGTPEGRVTFHGKDATTRDLLNEICR